MNEIGRQVRQVVPPQNVIRHHSNLQLNADQQRPRKAQTGTYGVKKHSSITRAHASTKPSQRTANQLLTKREDSEFNHRNRHRAQSRRQVPPSLFQPLNETQGTILDSQVSQHAFEQSKTGLIKSSLNAIENTHEQAMSIIAMEETSAKDRYQTIQTGKKVNGEEADYTSLEEDEANSRRQIGQKRFSQGYPVTGTNIAVPKKQFPGHQLAPRHGSKRRSTMTQREQSQKNYADPGSRKQTGKAVAQTQDNDLTSGSYRTLGSLDNLNYTSETGARDKSTGRRKSQSNPRQFAVSGRVGDHGSSSRQVPIKQNFNGRVVITKGKRKSDDRNGSLKISNEHGYASGGPNEAYTSQLQSMQQSLKSQHLPLNAQTIQITQETNRAHLGTHAERANSIDSAGYEIQNLKAGLAAARSSGGVDPNPAKDFTLQPLNQGFSQMLKQTIINKAMEQKKAQQQSQLDESRTENLAVMDKYKSSLTSNNNSYLTKVSDGKGQKADSFSEKDSMHQGRLETLIQQLIVRKEITQSPHINQRPNLVDKTGQNLANLSLQMASQMHGHGAAGRKKSAAGFKENQLHFAKNQLVQKHSAEDLLNVDKEASCSPAAIQHVNLTRNLAMNQIKIKTNRPNQQSQQHHTSATVKNINLASKVKSNSANKTVGQLNKVTNLNGQNLKAINRLSNEPEQRTNSLFANGPKGFTLSANADGPVEAQNSSFNNNMSDSICLPQYLSWNNGTQQNLKQSTIKGNNISDSNASFTGNTATHNFMSLDQSKGLNQPNVNQSDGSLGEIYHKTLSAFQSDLNYLQEINQTREEIGARLQKHQSILNSLQAEAIGSKRNSQQDINEVQYQQQVMHHPMQTLQQEAGQFVVKNKQQNMYLQGNQTKSKSINSTLLVNQSHRGSTMEPSLLASGPGINSVNNNTLATSPIVGRYRLKHLNNPNNQITNVYHNNTNRAMVPNQPDTKRTKSVRQRRGIPIGGGNSNPRGGRKLVNAADGFKQQTHIPGGHKNYDSLMLAYRSIGGENQSSLINPTSSQQSFSAPGQTQQFQTQRKLLQTTDSSNLTQTYGVTQKYGSSLVAKTKGHQRTMAAGRSVPRQRGFSSNMRPPIKQSERSISNNRNQVNQSFRNTNSFVARNTYASQNSGSINSQHQQQLYGSQNVQQSFNPNTSGAISQEVIENVNTVSPINQGSKVVKYGRIGTVQQQQAKRVQKKSTSRGRGAVANSTSMAAPGVRKHSNIVQGQKAAQMSQQQVYKIRGSLQTQAERVRQLTAQVSPGGGSSPHDNSPSRLSPDQLLKNIGSTPEMPDASPVNYRRQQNQYQRHSQGQQKPNSLSNDVKHAIMEDFNNQMSVGGQVIVNPAGIQSTGSGVQNFNRNHNLRYSQHNEEFSQMLDEEIKRELPATISNAEALQRQDEAMKLINDDNPFENHIQQQIGSSRRVEALAKEEQTFEVEQADKHDSGSSQTMSFAETKTRTSKNTNGTTAISGMSGGFTNQLTFSKLSRKVVPSGAGPSTGQGRLSLLGAGAMRRSEMTEDSQQCTYMDGNLIMSSLPMPMHSIKQVIAEEEAAAEQDERTTNKESSKQQNQQQTKGSNGSKGQGTEAQSSSNRDTGGDNGEPASRKSAKNLIIQYTESESPKLMQSISKTNTIKPDDECYERASESGVNICESPRSRNLHSQSVKDLKNQKSRAQTSQSIKYSMQSRISKDLRNSNKISSDGQIQQQTSLIEDSGVICEITPNIMVAKDNRVAAVLEDKKSSDNQSVLQILNKRQPDQISKVLDDFPPQLSESSARVKPSGNASEQHSDDDVEIRRGLEPESARTDMGSNPELLRQSTHSLLHKTQIKDTDTPADLLVLQKQTSEKKFANARLADAAEIEENSINAISDEIDVRLSNSSSLNLRKGVGEAQNNNYFGEDQSTKNKNYTRKTNNKAKIKQFEQFEDSEEILYDNEDNLLLQSN